jgi:hypothetical protein
MPLVTVPTTAHELVAATEQALALAPAQYPPTLPGKPELLGAPERYPFEHQAWPIGEAIRQAFLAHPALRRSAQSVEAVVRVIEQRNLRTGRQSFVMAIGFVAARPFAPRIAAFLADPDIGGHVIGTLAKMKAAGYVEEVRPLLQSTYAWVRRAAKRYI